MAGASRFRPGLSRLFPRMPDIRRRRSRACPLSGCRSIDATSAAGTRGAAANLPNIGALTAFTLPSPRGSGRGGMQVRPRAPLGAHHQSGRRRGEPRFDGVRPGRRTLTPALGRRGAGRWVVWPQTIWSRVRPKAAAMPSRSRGLGVQLDCDYGGSGRAGRRDHRGATRWSHRVLASAVPGPPRSSVVATPP